MENRVSTVASFEEKLHFMFLAMKLIELLDMRLEARIVAMERCGRVAAEQRVRDLENEVRHVCRLEHVFKPFIQH